MLQSIERSLPLGHNGGPPLGEKVKSAPIHSLMTLVLNADFQPLTTYPLSLEPIDEAITRLWKKRATTVETWKDAFGEELIFRSPSVSIAAPKVIVLLDYVSISSEPKFSRRSILLRDRYCCQYCGQKFTAKELTFDHVIPRARGGKTVWTNILSACMPCNAKKAQQLPQYSGRKGKNGNGLRPLKTPYQPTNAELLKVGLEFIPDQTREDFGSWLYWNVEILP